MSRAQINNPSVSEQPHGLQHNFSGLDQVHQSEFNQQSANIR